jgi:hypothetical protein
LTDLDLATVQRGLHRLIKHSAAPEGPYFRLVANSEELQVVRDIVFWWRIYGLEATAPFTSALLKRCGVFEKSISAFLSSCALSPFYETQVQAFLEFVAAGDDLERAVASFELALYRVQLGDPSEHQIDFTHDPAEVLEAVITGKPLEFGPPGRWRVVVSAGIPDKFRIERHQSRVSE